MQRLEDEVIVMATAIDPTQLIPAAAGPGYVPRTDLEWLEPLRTRHEQLAARLASASRGPNEARTQHAARVAAWRAEVRAAAWAGVDPPAWTARLGDDWRAGRVDAAEAAIASIVGEIFEVLREADAACDGHALDALVAPVDDGYGGALVAMERKLAGRPAMDALPPWATNVREWRAWRNQRDKELHAFGRRDGGTVDANPPGGTVRGSTLEDHAAEERARVERFRNTAAERMAAANTTNDEQRWSA